MSPVAISHLVETLSDLGVTARFEKLVDRRDGLLAGGQRRDFGKPAADGGNDLPQSLLVLQSTHRGGACARLRPEDGAGTDYDGTPRRGPFAWVGSISYSNIAEARDDRFVASAELRGAFLYAYIARAVTPGRYAMPAVQIEDMYCPGVMARTATGAVTIAPRGG